MKKNYILMSGLVFGSLIGFAQNLTTNQQILDNEVKANFSSTPLKMDPDLMKKSKFNSKAFGDTLFYEPFANSIPTGWTVVNNNANNFQWVWNNTYQAGQFSQNTPAIASTTTADGFMVLTGDFFNTPIPPGGAVAMDTYFESPAITITPTPGVWVTYQQSLRYCCSSANRLVLQVSNDNFLTFQEFDATNDIAVNAATGTVDNVINISSVAANQPSIKIRFLSEGNSHYYWMIDDFAVIEGPANDLELTSPYMEFNEANHTYYPFYGSIPYDLFPPLPFFGIIKNNGYNVQTGVRLAADVSHTADPAGNPGQGLQYSVSTLANPSIVLPDSSYSVLTGTPRFVPTVLGDFQVDFLATGDSVDENLGNEDAIAIFSVTDTLFARDDNGFGGGTGPGSYVDGSGTPGGTAVGDRFATTYIVESRTGNGGTTKVPTSITYRVSADPTNIGVEIVPKIWAFDDDSLFVNGVFSVDRAVGAEVASSFIPYTVTANDTNTFITLPLDNGPAVFNGMDSGMYIVGWETTSIAGGTDFQVLNDGSSAARQSPVTSFVYFGHNPGWGWVAVNPGIRLNMGNLPVSTGLKSSVNSDVTFNVSPNPNNGLFKLNVTSKNQVAYNLNISIPAMTSFPLPPLSRSLPLSPKTQSSPSPPSRMSIPRPPYRMSLPAPPSANRGVLTLLVAKKTSFPSSK